MCRKRDRRVSSAWVALIPWAYRVENEMAKLCKWGEKTFMLMTLCIPHKWSCLCWWDPLNWWPRVVAHIYPQLLIHASLSKDASMVICNKFVMRGKVHDFFLDNSELPYPSEVILTFYGHEMMHKWSSSLHTLQRRCFPPSLYDRPHFLNIYHTFSATAQGTAVLPCKRK